MKFKLNAMTANVLSYKTNFNDSVCSLYKYKKWCTKMMLFEWGQKVVDAMYMYWKQNANSIIGNESFIQQI